MRYKKTIKIPIHYKTTENKLSCLDNLTARLTYAVKLWSQVIGKNDLKNRLDCSTYEHEIQKQIKLSSAFVQQARDKALWVWKQHEKAYKVN